MKKVLTLLTLGLTLSIGAIYAQTTPTPPPELLKALETATAARTAALAEFEKAKAAAAAAAADAEKARVAAAAAAAVQAKAEAAVQAANDGIQKAQSAIAAATRPPAPPAPTAAAGKTPATCEALARSQNIPANFMGTFVSGCMAPSGSPARNNACVLQGSGGPVGRPPLTGSAMADFMRTCTTRP